MQETTSDHEAWPAYCTCPNCIGTFNQENVSLGNQDQQDFNARQEVERQHASAYDNHDINLVRSLPIYQQIAEGFPGFVLTPQTIRRLEQWEAL